MHSTQWRQRVQETRAGELMRQALSRLLPDGQSFPFACRLVADSLADDGASDTLAVTTASLLLAGSNMPLRRPGALVAGESAASALNPEPYTMSPSTRACGFS